MALTGGIRGDFLVNTQRNRNHRKEQAGTKYLPCGDSSANDPGDLLAGQVSNEGGSGTGFKYENNPSDNPKVLRDAIIEMKELHNKLF